MRYLKPLFVVCVALLVSAAANAQDSDNSAAASNQTNYALPDVTKRLWTGDLDGMIERRMIRVLVAYSKTHYFVDRGTQYGLSYEFGRLFEDDLNKKLKKRHIRVHVVFVPVSRDQLIPALLEGRGDVAGANLTITPERLKKVDFTNPTFTNVSEIVVTAPGGDPLTTVMDLSGKEVYLRKSSSYYESVEKLNRDLAKAKKPTVKVREAPENLEDEDILEMVNAGLIKATIVDNHIAEFWKQVLPKLVLNTGAAVRTDGQIGPMIRKKSPQLQAELNEFFARYPKGSATRNILLQKYLRNTKFAREATSPDEIAKFERTIELFRTYGDRYKLDYLLMAAQGYQESRLDQNVRSPVGAVGVMQIMPATGKEMNVGDIHHLEPNIHAGVKYIRFMMDQFYKDEPMDEVNKGLFTFASYNAGPGRVMQLRKEAAKRGLDPNRWFNNVEVVAAEKVGRETVQYVSNIYKYYLAYTLISEERKARKKVKETIKENAK